jgi:hypothetical protein
MEDYEFYPYLDIPGNDIKQINLKDSDFLEKIKGCIAFNTLGFVKSKIDELEITPYINYNTPNQGIYILKKYPLQIEKNLHLLYKKYKIVKDPNEIQNYIKFFRPFKLSTQNIIHSDWNVWKDYFPNLGQNNNNSIAIYDFKNQDTWNLILSKSPDVIYLTNFENKCLENYDIHKIDKTTTVLYRKQSIVYVRGISGLANNMFQIATAIYYAEKYNIKILLDWNSETLKNGTSKMFQRNVQRENENYFDNIFSKFDVIDFTNRIYKTNITVIYNNNECNQIIPKENEHFLISGYSQNYKLFIDVIDKLEKYFCLDDNKTKDHIFSKYPKLKNKDEIHLCIGIRIGKDFQHMNKLTSKSYEKAFNYYLKHYFQDKKVNIYVLSDVKEGWEKMVQSYKNIEINLISEDDITQFYVGLECNYFILSESTYHYWIALLAYYRNKERKVLVFNDTDLTNRPLALPEWIHIDY